MRMQLVFASLSDRPIVDTIIRGHHDKFGGAGGGYECMRTLGPGVVRT
jgi:hypothetical protein